MHPSRTPHHAYQTPMRDPGGLFSFVLIFLSVPNFQWMKGYFRLAHMHSLIFSCLSLSPFASCCPLINIFVCLYLIVLKIMEFFKRQDRSHCPLSVYGLCVCIYFICCHEHGSPSYSQTISSSVPTLVNLEWESIAAFCTIHSVFAIHLVCSVIICPFNCYSNTNT